LNETLEIDDEKLKICAANIGNPHCIVLDRNISAEDTKRLGPMVENHSKFPNRTNVQFLEVLNRNKIRIEIWERGSGYTLSSGSSSCAAASIAYKLGLCDREIVVLMPGGEIYIQIHKNYNITMKGPVTRIGEMKLDPECLENDFPK
jgi:diaminopimelate epimerase